MALKKKAKDVSKAGSKVNLKPEPSSMRLVDSRYSFFTDTEGMNKQLREKRKKMEEAKSSKRGIKEANRNPRLSKSAKATRAEAERLAANRAKAVYDERVRTGKEANKRLTGNDKPVKISRRMNPAEKLAYDRSILKTVPSKAPSRIKRAEYAIQEALRQDEKNRMAAKENKANSAKAQNKKFNAEVKAAAKAKAAAKKKTGPTAPRGGGGLRGGFGMGGGGGSGRSNVNR
jgi:membrane protein involved in colicin uptake